MDREKVIAWLADEELYYRDHGDAHNSLMACDALALLKFYKEHEHEACVNCPVGQEKHGEWIEYPECLAYKNALSKTDIVCSECGHVFSTMDNCTEEFNFCPHCGADMRGEYDV